MIESVDAFRRQSVGVGTVGAVWEEERVSPYIKIGDFSIFFIYPLLSFFTLRGLSSPPEAHKGRFFVQTAIVAGLPPGWIR